MEDLIYNSGALAMADALLQGGLQGLIVSLVLVLFTLIGLNFSKKFSEANEEFINANPTTISNKIILQISGVILFLAVTGFWIGSFASVPDVAEYLGWFAVIQSVLTTVFVAALLYAIVAIYFQPDRANLKEDKSSSVAEDMIGLSSFALKIPLVLSSFISTALMTLGAFYLIVAFVQNALMSIDSNGEFFYFEASEANVLTGVSYFLSGAFAPFIFYLLFLIFFPVYNYLLAILHIPKIGK
tara:strand:- start:292 stop:1017 length:726 start_codon:yes stop_codon:yes gene_type:complete